MKLINLSFSIFFVSSSLLQAGIPYFEPTRPLYKGSYEIKTSGRYFQKSASYDVNGAKVEMQEGTDFNLIEGDMSLGYAFGEKLSAYGGVRGRQVNSENNNTGKSLSNSGLESVFAGAKYSFSKIDQWRFALEAIYRQTTYSNTVYNVGEQLPDKIVIGDSGVYFSLLTHTTFDLSKKNIFSLSVGYTRTPGHISPEVPYRLETAFKGRKVALIGGVEGIFSLEQDEYTSNPETKPQMATGESSQFNSINKSFVMPYGAVHYSGSRKWSIGAKFGQIISGTSTDKGMEGSVFLTWRSIGFKEDTRVKNTFKSYEVEGEVLKVSPRGNFLKIDKGLADDIEKGMVFDIFKSDFLGENILYATGRVFKLKATSAIIKIVRKYKNKSIEKGFVARGRTD